MRRYNKKEWAEIPEECKPLLVQLQRMEEREKSSKLSPLQAKALVHERRKNSEQLSNLDY